MTKGRLAVFGVALLLSACNANSKPAETATATAAPSTLPELAPLADKYGFVRMDTLMQSHPSAGQLAALNQQIDTLRAQVGAPQSSQDAAKLRATQVELQHELEAAAKRAQGVW